MRYIMHMTKQPFILALAGPSGSGKTTLLEKLIVLFASSGVRVGAIKRSHHRVELDHEGKDSWRFKQAGAAVTALVSENLTAIMERTENAPELSEVLMAFNGKVDMALVEGFKNEQVQMLVFLAGDGAPSITGDDAAGYVTAGAAPPGGLDGKPVFHRDDINGIAEWIYTLSGMGEWQ